jgi:hypothetical protein
MHCLILARCRALHGSSQPISAQGPLPMDGRTLVGAYVRQKEDRLD